jgi:hypothetical protein
MFRNQSKFKKILKITYFSTVHILALIGLMFVGVFFAIRLKLTNVSGTIDNLSDSFQNQILDNRVLGVNTSATTSINSEEIGDIENKIQKLTVEKELKTKNICALEELSYTAPKNVEKIIAAKKNIKSDYVVSQMIFAVETYLTDKDVYNQNVSKCIGSYDPQRINEDEIENRVKNSISKDIFVWPDEEQWKVVEDSVIKDKEIINKAAIAANIEPRLIVSDLIVEQLRIYYSARELYKKYFEPLKILANSNKISLGVMAIKEETAIAIENHLKDKDSPYYLGPEYEHLLDYPNDPTAEERYKRLTSNDHFYSYLYAGLYLKQMMKQWQDAGYDISKRPEIIGTLFNVGFPQSKPNDNPKVGGSTVQIGQNQYSFGRLSFEFYYSGELLEEFPYINNL